MNKIVLGLFLGAGLGALERMADGLVTPAPAVRKEIVGS